jgi:arginyl-tRNA synthetase
VILEIQQELAGAVREAVREAFALELEAVAFQYPPRVELGDLALTAPFDLAKRLRRKPREIAEALAARLARLPGVVRAEVAGGGYVNLYLERAAAARRLHEALAGGRRASAQPGHVIVEHTSINPNKAAHIGHLRNACLGDTLVVGFQHIERRSLPQLEAIEGRFDYHCWDLYARVGDFYAADPRNKALQAEALHAIEQGGNDTARLAEQVAARIVERHLATMARLGIRYDLLAHESDILRLHFWDRAFELLQERGAIRQEAAGRNQGCWVLPMGEGDESAIDEDKIIVRSNGTVTYTGKDIAYQLWKLGALDRDFRYRAYRREADGHVLWTTTSGEGEPGAPRFGHASAVYNVIDVGQSYPQRVVKAGVLALGHAAGAAGSHHLAYEKVVLSPATARALGYDVSEDEAAVKVSGRKGLGVKADDLLDALEAKARAEVEARDPGREAAAREATARAVATGALRYFMLRFSRARVITFDMEEALAFTGETGPYVQNAVVRGRNIFGKLEAEGHSVPALLQRARAAGLERFLEGEEGDEVWSLLLLMARSEDVAEQAIRAEDVALLAKHAFAVAQAFHSYYQKPRYSLLHAESEELRACRTLVVDAFVRQLQILLELLGIPVPDRM